MAPITASPMETVDQLVAANTVMVFSKTTCPFCTKIKSLFERLKVKIEVLELDQIGKQPFQFPLNPTDWVCCAARPLLSCHRLLAHNFMSALCTLIMER